MKSIFYFSILMTFGCGQLTQNDNKFDKPIEDTLIKYRVPSQEGTINEQNPFTKNPTTLYIKNNKLYFDSLRNYFIYKEIDRLDKICNEVSASHLDNLPYVVFDTNAFNPRHRRDTVFLNNYQYLVGNIKPSDNMPNILIFYDFYEEWGGHLLLISVDKNNDIIDIEFICQNGGDGGEFETTELNYLDTYNYTYKHIRGTMTEEWDTTKYNLVWGSFKINKDGTFIKNITLQKDSIAIEKLD